MPVLVDTSIWVDYFRSGRNSGKLDFLIDENIVVTNDLILSELIPFLRIRNRRKIIALLQSLERLDLSIDWKQIMEYRYRCLKNGLNGIGIPDLIIAQNAKQNRSEIYSLDRHFVLMREILNIRVQE
jgi:predicted nucleic acid-binding protein